MEVTPEGKRILTILNCKPRESQLNQEAVIDSLRKLLSAAESGDLTGYVALAVMGGEFEINFSAGVSKLEAVAYCSMLHDRAIAQMYA